MRELIVSIYVLLLPIRIIIDSKRRLGRVSWVWVILYFLLCSTIMVVWLDFLYDWMLSDYPTFQNSFLGKVTFYLGMSIILEGLLLLYQSTVKPKFSIVADREDNFSSKNKKLIEQIKTNFDSKSTDELLEIWVNNNRSEFTAEVFVIIQEIFISRGQVLPEQNEFLDKTKKQIDLEQLNKLIKREIPINIIWGIINIAFWYMSYAEIRNNLDSNFIEIKPLLWILLYGQLIIGSLLLFIGFFGLLFRKPIVLLLAGLSLLILGLWNITSDFLVISTLAQYNIIITLDDVLEDANILWYLLGAAQLYWGLSQIGDFKRVVFPDAFTPVITVI